MTYKSIRQIGSIYRSLEYISNVEFKQFGLNNNQYVYLVRIGEKPGIISNELSKLIKVDKTTVSRNIKRLIEMKFITRVDADDNRKEKKLFLTENGRVVFNRIISEHEYSNQKMLSGLNDDEIKTFNQLLQKVENNTDQEWENVKNGKERKY
ncbi:MarR family transcriptional regulator [Lactobacillus sp. S2-2]|uniref:MarR family winged helix-turn-helix transcriptional regulator n=1 Tax=Lactobacillus sp. S2-2 TaxID=2692917 RepID=UPI001F45F6DD|nr:MarR family winged helix-turn-helix transcriptional regulator [Lactobacillus sp. S2-2]MCF6515733.1 MarR family transcriptional regulator [Lactobacillus sp. S2-2]